MPQLKQFSRLAKDVNNQLRTNWFPGHMYAGMRAMVGKLNTTDCVIEVHDARIPTIGRNTEFRKHLGYIKPHILVLNKMDLADLSNWQHVSDKLAEQGDTNVMLTDLSGSNFGYRDRGYNNLMTEVVKLINQNDRNNRKMATDFKVMFVGIPNVGKSSLINRLRQYHLGLKGEPAKIGPVAGVTRHVEMKIKICSRPLVYSLDTPGVLEPSCTRNKNKTMQLAACGTIYDAILDPYELASYILKYLNNKGNYAYTNVIGLKQPIDDINELFRQALSEDAKELGSRHYTLKSSKVKPDINKFCWHYIRQFRLGYYGSIMFG